MNISAILYQKTDNLKMAICTRTTQCTIIIRMNISAIDGDYDFIQPDYGIKASITKGNTGVVEFSPWIDGKYMFFCEQCGGMPGQGKGYIIVASK